MDNPLGSFFRCTNVRTKHAEKTCVDMWGQYIHPSKFSNYLRRLLGSGWGFTKPPVHVRWFDHRILVAAGQCLVIIPPDFSRQPMSGGMTTEDWSSAVNIQWSNHQASSADQSLVIWPPKLVNDCQSPVVWPPHNWLSAPKSDGQTTAHH